MSTADHDPHQAALAAARRAAQAHARIEEIEQRLTDLRRGRGADVAPDPPTDAVEVSHRAVAHTVEAVQRARDARQASIAAYEAAARAHDRAAAAHERAAEAGVGDVDEHRQLARWHRAHAAADRAAGRRERLGPEPDEGAAG